jgi:hypothetical protein
MNTIDMAKDNFEGRFFDLLTESFKELRADVRKDLKDINKQIADNTKITEDVKTETHKTNNRVKKLEGIVYRKRTSPLNFLQDRQLVYIFLTALMVFLLILANVLGVRIPAW